MFVSTTKENGGTLELLESTCRSMPSFCKSGFLFPNQLRPGLGGIGIGAYHFSPMRLVKLSGPTTSNYRIGSWYGVAN